MQLAVLVIKESPRSFLCQGCHWIYGDDLHKILTTHHPTLADAQSLVLGNKISEIEEDGTVVRSKPICETIKLRTLKSAAYEECLTVHYHNGKEWTFRVVNRD